MVVHIISMSYPYLPCLPYPHSTLHNPKTHHSPLSHESASLIDKIFGFQKKLFNLVLNNAVLVMVLSPANSVIGIIPEVILY